MGRPSKGVGVARWLVSRTSGLLDARLSRRSFISRATLVGTAVAATGCSVITEQGSPYTRIVDCPPGTLCRDGYTEFCCVINNGLNACPSGTVAAGWWRADRSQFCFGGTRYYIDCNEVCCGPVRGDGFCAGCHPCQCADDCNTRKVHCNYFRYGQCNQWIARVGPIACRMVTCTPPYQMNIGCSPSGAVDQSTVNHNANCAAYVPPPPPPAPMAAVLPALSGATIRAAGTPAVFARHADTAVYFRELVSGSWTGWTGVGGSATSGGSAVPSGSGQMMMLGRLSDNALYQFVSNGSTWTPTKLGGDLASDPFALVHNGETFVFYRSNDRSFHWRRLVGGAWTAPASLFGIAASTPVAASTGSQIFMFGRLADIAIWYSVWSGSAWSAPQSLNGLMHSDPGAAALGANVGVFALGEDRTLWGRRFDGSVWSQWFTIAPEFYADPKAVTFGSHVYVFGRSSRFELAYTRSANLLTWEPVTTIGPSVMSDIAATVDGGTLHVFASHSKTRLGHLAFDGATWSAWEDLGGDLSLIRGT
jgi:hypothetical protein